MRLLDVTGLGTFVEALVAQRFLFELCDVMQGGDLEARSILAEGIREAFERHVRLDPHDAGGLLRNLAMSQINVGDLRPGLPLLRTAQLRYRFARPSGNKSNI
jgi:hypothetical protein